MPKFDPNLDQIIHNVALLRVMTPAYRDSFLMLASIESDSPRLVMLAERYCPLVDEAGLSEAREGVHHHGETAMMMEMLEIMTPDDGAAWRQYRGCKRLVARYRGLIPQLRLADRIVDLMDLHAARAARTAYGVQVVSRSARPA